MKTVFNSEHSQHDPGFFLVKGSLQASTEQPERAQRLLAGVERLGLEVISPTDFGDAARSAVHSRRYLDFLSVAHQQWTELPGASKEVIANIHPLEQPASYPQSIVGRAGWHMADTACPLGEFTFAAACGSANSAVTATQCVIDGDQSAYALCRPPGHHAYAERAGGFCFLNNAAIAAAHALKVHERVAILDVDVHHGNGTQGIFYNRSDVLTVSIHADPQNFYPFYWGHSQETGAEKGEGYNLNMPLPLLSGDTEFIRVLHDACERIEQFNPGVLLVALGLDASEADPLRGLSVTTEGFGQIGRVIAEMERPTVLIQEGGYLSDLLTDNLAAVLSAFAGKNV